MLVFVSSPISLNSSQAIFRDIQANQRDNIMLCFKVSDWLFATTQVIGSWQWQQVKLYFSDIETTLSSENSFCP